MNKAMFSNYLLIAFENIKRQPGFTAIKVLSQALGLGCSILVLMHAQYSLSFDRHFPNGENIYRVVTGITTDQRMDFQDTVDAVAVQMKLDYPQIENIARMSGPYAGEFARGDMPFINDFHWAEPDVIDIFSLQFVSGNKATALDEPYSLVLNETAAAKYFPGEEAVGQTLLWDNHFELRVTGVMRDLPENTHMDLQIIMSVASFRERFGERFLGGNSWLAWGGTQTYLTLPDRITADAISSDLPAFIDRHVPEVQRATATARELRLALQPLFDIYLDKHTGFGAAPSNRSQVLLALGLFALLILITSCLNFANLSLSQIKQRSREMGVRKTLGAKRGQIVLQFMFESLLLTGIALLLVIPVVYFTLPMYTNLTSATFTAASALSNGGVWLLPLFVLVTGALSGVLPALALSRIEPASIIKGLPLCRNASAWLHSGVTVVQFGFSTVLILLASAITLQIRHLNTMDVGFNKNNLVVLESTYNEFNPTAFDYAAMVNELKAHSGIVAVGESESTPPVAGVMAPWKSSGGGENDYKLISHNLVDVDYFDVMQLKLLAGRWFSEDFPTDFLPPPPPPPQTGQTPTIQPPSIVRGIVITRAAVNNFGLRSPEEALNQILINPNSNGGSFRVLGVVEDFHLTGGVEDMSRSTSILLGSLMPQRTLLIRIDPAQTDSALNHIDATWTQHRPDEPINRVFFAQTFNGIVYNRTNGINKAALLAGTITVLISTMGLYALAFYSTQRRTKEVGIRKVAGASSGKIIRLLTWDFLKPVLIACMMASIGGYFAIEYYLQQFSSRTEVSSLLYLAVTVGTLLISALTVATQCYRAANADPVKSLRYE
ncbi:MAG: FtsX-like permease family protein [Pseudomonadota bacterium]